MFLNYYTNIIYTNNYIKLSLKIKQKHLPKYILSNLIIYWKKTTAKIKIGVIKISLKPRMEIPQEMFCNVCFLCFVQSHPTLSCVVSSRKLNQSEDKEIIKKRKVELAT